jgi:hypothetical protein
MEAACASSMPRLLQEIPKALMSRSGKVFYSGRAAFTQNCPLYMLGINPGGDPEVLRSETVGSHSTWVLKQAPEEWSAYRDESWNGVRPGAYGMQPRVLHLLGRLGLNPARVPASNLVFVRSRRQDDLADFERSAAECWPFHHQVIEECKPRVVVCFGKRAGDYVRRRLGATTREDRFEELNARRWESTTHVASCGLRIVTLTHPSIANWRTRETDPSDIVLRALRTT